jgi:peptidoglycan/LPS O-acetylase OafA/YrhL
MPSKVAPHLKSRDYIPTLDGWRAIAISIVVIGHQLGSTVAVQGVGIFFGISGYLICTNLLVERERKGDISLKNFYGRRAFRILPASMMYLLAVGLLGAIGMASVTGADIAKAAFLAANYLPVHKEVHHFWSLSMEEHFYLFWPAMLAFLGNRRARIGAFVLIIVVFVWRTFSFYHHYDIINTTAVARTDLRLDVFLIPCLMAIVLRDPVWRQRAQRMITPVVCIALFVVLGLMKAFRDISPLFASFEMLFQAFMYPVFIIYTVFNPTSLSGRFLELSPLRWIGRISYSIYLWQQVFTRDTWFGTRVPTLPLKLAAVLALASLSYYLLERPMIRIGRSLQSDRPAPKPKLQTPEPVPE